jgi:hypothetical protein
MKGKCALGPFLSILVIECQHKCLSVKVCKAMDKVQIKSKGMFLDLVHCLWTNVLCLSAENRRNQVGKEMALFSQSLHSLGALDSVRCTRLARANWLLSGLRRRCTAINHRTVRWCIGLSGEPFIGEVVALGKRLTAYGYNSPDCPVSQRSSRPTVGRGFRA